MLRMGYYMRLMRDGHWVLIWILMLSMGDTVITDLPSFVTEREVATLLCSTHKMQADLSLSLHSPPNNSLITNRSEILCRLTGSLDKTVFYHWSTEGTNNSFVVAEEYFLILPPALGIVELNLTLAVYASTNSSDPLAEWTTLSLTYRYDTKAPSFTSSLTNTSTIYSFTTLIITVSESLLAGSYCWDGRGNVSLDPTLTSFILDIEHPEGTHTLDLVLQDLNGNTNHSSLVFDVMFTLTSFPPNNSRIQTGTLVGIEFSDPYNALYAWDAEGYSGVIDPTPAGEGSHVLHVMVEKAVGVFEVWNFTFIVDNTPIVIQVDPAGGVVPAGTNLTVTVDEIQQTIWLEVENATSELTINGSDPYWVILPSEYGEVNLTIYATDEAGNLGKVNYLFTIAIGVYSITPTNDTVVDQNTTISVQLNAGEWRTILFNLDNSPYNSTYPPSIPTTSGKHTLLVFIEDVERRWVGQYYQWWVRPHIQLDTYANHSHIKDEYPLFFFFNEMLPQVIYSWEDDPPSMVTDVSSITTSMSMWSNMTAPYGHFMITAEGKDQVWNNQSYRFIRDNTGIHINLAEGENDTIIFTPYEIWLTFNETPVEIRYAWDGGENVTDVAVFDPYFLNFTSDIATNPHALTVFVRDGAYNWNSQRYVFHRGTELKEISVANGTTLRGGDTLRWNVTAMPLRLGVQWMNATDASNLTVLEWVSPAENYSTVIPTVDGQCALILWYDLNNNLLINQTLHYLLDSTQPQVTVRHYGGPFAGEIAVGNASTVTVSPDLTLICEINENLSQFILLWNHATVVFNETAPFNTIIAKDSQFLVILDEMTREVNVSTYNLTASLGDGVGNTAYYIWYFQFDIVPPAIQTIDPTPAAILPNATITLTFNESVQILEVHWLLGSQVVTNDTHHVVDTTIRLLSPLADGVYSLDLSFCDSSGNENTQKYQYTVDGTAPSIDLSYLNTSHFNSKAPLTGALSEPVTIGSFYRWDDRPSIPINQTSLTFNVSLAEGVHTLTFYLEDAIGNHRTMSYQFTLDNTPIAVSQTSLPLKFYDSNTKYLRVYFDERPTLVYGSWDKGTNFTLPVQTQQGMVFGVFVAEASTRYYVMVELPTANFESHRLTLSILDAAENWERWSDIYTKLPSFLEWFPFVFVILTGVAVFVYIQRTRIKSWWETRQEKKLESNQEETGTTTEKTDRQKLKSTKRKKRR